MHNTFIKLEYDPKKSAINLAKHGVNFEEAATSLLDELALAFEDKDSESENRWVLIGMSSSAKLLTVVYTLREPDIIRLISARKATKREAKHYAE